jgi:ParB family chromosome partitioning protein
MASNGINISLKSYDSIFQNDEQRNSEEIKPVPILELKPFTEQPFKVRLDEDMDALVDSIKQCGVLTPIIARPHKDGGYEILSGHRRVKACELAGITQIPVVVKNLDDDTATILLVDSNLQREHILPSEKAFAYQMKLEAMKRKAGRPLKENVSQIGTNFEKVRSDEELAEQVGESRNQIQRYIRLTNLIDPILQMVDDNQIAMNAAVELSYLGSKEQAAVMQSIEKEDTSPSIAQAKKIRKFHQDGKLNEAVIDSIMMEQKPETIKITLGEDKLKKYFPKSYTKAKMEEIILKLLDKWHRQRENEKER